jgi:TPR repeat protein
MITNRTRNGNELDIWDTETGAHLGVVEGHTLWINDFNFSPDGSLIVTASADQTARLWDARTGKAVAILKGHDAAVVSAEFSPDGRMVVTGSRDGTAQLWTVLPLSGPELVDYSRMRAVRDLNEAERSRYSLTDNRTQSNWTQAKGSINDCDRLAAHPRDPQKRTTGVTFENIKEDALAVCRLAFQEHPQDPHYMFQLARVLAKKGETAEARDLLERAAAGGYGAAHNNIAVSYQKGENGFQQDSAAAISHYEAAFKKGVLICADAIAAMYWRGEGVEQDRNLAVEWLRRGAAAGSPLSHTNLAYLYEHGEEVDYSLERALLHWTLGERLYDEAALRGTESASTSFYSRVRRIALSRDMPAKVVAQIASEVSRWTPTAP